MIHPATLTFLRDLKKNNNKDWFDKHKERYLAAKENMAALTDTLLKDLARMDKKLAGLGSKDCLFRIYRDVRFSKDKRPYKVNMGASMNAGGKKAVNAGYYLHIEPGGSFLAGGIWMPPGDALKKIRQEIDYNGKQLRKILAQKDFSKYFGQLDDTYKLKTTPKGYDKEHADIELLRFNSYIVWHQYSDKEVTGKNFAGELAKGSKLMKPLIDFLNTALD
jgi:uncharacterized protein (TIGR02453 family)